MYSTIKNYSHDLLTQQTESQTVTINPESETELIKFFHQDALDTHLTESIKLVGDSGSEFAKFTTLVPENKAEPSSSIEINFDRLEQEVDRLGKTVIQAKERKLNFVNRQFSQGMDNLQYQAEHINELATQLETEILKFQDMAKKVNRDYHAIQHTHQQANPTLLPSDRTKPANIWAIRSCQIPIVIKQGDRLILTSKQVLEVSQDSAEQRVKKAQQRQKALECWLEAKRQRIVEDFSRP